MDDHRVTGGIDMSMDNFAFFLIGLIAGALGVIGIIVHFVRKYTVMEVHDNDERTAGDS